MPGVLCSETHAVELHIRQRRFSRRRGCGLEAGRRLYLLSPAAPALDAASARTGRFRQNSRSRRGLGCRGVGPALPYSRLGGAAKKLKNEAALKICLSSRDL